MIQTGGFSPSVMPQVQYADPRLLTPNYGGIIPAMSQGVSFAEQIAQVARNAKEQPIRDQLLQIQLEEAKNRLGQAPLEAQLRALQIGRQSQPIENVTDITIERVPRIGSPYDTPALDANGKPTFDPDSPPDYDIVPVRTVVVTDPLTGQKTTRQERGAPISTAEQLISTDQKAELAAAREASLAAQRGTMAQLARERLSNPDWKRVGWGTDANGKAVFVLVNSKTGEKSELPTELAPVQTAASGIEAALNKLTGGTPAPKNIAAPAAVAVAAPEDTPAIDAETETLISDLTKTFTIPGVASTQATVPEFANLAEANAAVASGKLKKGQKITVGGKTGTWQ